MGRYAKLRGSYHVKSRSRKELLPYSSFVFIVSIAILASVYFFTSSSKHADDMLVTNIRSAGDYGDLCTPGKGTFSKDAYLAFLIPGIIFCFIGLAIVTDDYFVSALEQICEQLNLSEDVAGATFMAAGSSTPEFFASLLGVFVTRDEVGIGTIVGSAVFNILVIIGLSAALAGATLKLDWRPLARDSFFYMVSVTLLLVFTCGPSRGVIRWYEGLILVCVYAVYVLFMAFGNRRYMNWAGKFGVPNQEPDLERGEGTSSTEQFMPKMPQPTLAASPMTSSTIGLTPDGKRRYRDLNPRTRFKAAQIAVIATRRLASSSSSQRSDAESDGQYSPSSPTTQRESNERTFLGIDLPSTRLGWAFFPFAFPWKIAFRFTILDCSREKLRKFWVITFITSIIWISGISYMNVEAARISGCLLGIPAPAMGLTVLAAGTSVPDALASISVARNGAGDTAVSNAIGSNVFDILPGLGLPWFLGDLILDGSSTKPFAIDIPVQPISRVVVPIIILFAIMIVFLVILVVLKWTMKPLLGYLLFALYFVFVAYTLLDVYVFKFGQKS